MIQDYKAILDALPTAAGVARPLYGDAQEIVDFSIEYVNAAFRHLTKNAVHEGYKYSEFKALVSPDIPWESMAMEAVTQNGTVRRTSYSVLCGCWLHIAVSCALPNHVAVTLTDVSDDKETEQQLRRQNLRLAALTDELSGSRDDLLKDLEKLRTLNEQLDYAAYHDTLTNLPNRAAFNRYVAQVLDQPGSGKKFGIIMLDIDNIKNVNESSGHNAGDRIIRQAATCLRKFEGNSIAVFRFGGDEFIVLQTNLGYHDQILDLGRQMLKECNRNGIRISGGITLFPDDSQKAEDLLKLADMAVAEVKRNGKNNVVFFQQVMQEKFLKKLNIENKLTKAMADQVFQLYFQPQFDVSGGTLRGFEALLRWHDDDLGWISPDQFIPLAEESHLVVPLGDWVMETALATLARWERGHGFAGILSVNVSPVQFGTDDFLDKLKEKVARHGVAPAHLEIEVTESILISNVDDTVRKLNEIRAMGIGVSLDDFGTGYSSLRYLRLLPLTTLKIDKSFISGISAEGGVEANITESIVSLVSKLGLDTIAEGVETTSQLDLLKKFDCHNVQGFLKGKPMPPDLCERMLDGDASAVLTVKDDTPEST